MVPALTQREPTGLLLSLVVMGLCGCSQVAKKAPSSEDGNTTEVPVKERSPDEEALSFLLSMTWEEACALTTQHLEWPPQWRLAAEEIEVLKAAPDGSPRRARARGKVYIELTLDEPARLMAQEAFVSEHEVILRGKPLLQRGGSLVEGLDDSTVFYFLGPRLKVIGRHRVRNEVEVIAKAILVHPQGGSGSGSSGGFADPGPPPALPLRQGPWAGGPNPLLPPLSPESIPPAVRQKMIDEAGLIDVAPLQVPLGSDLPPAPGEITGPPTPAEIAPKPN